MAGQIDVATLRGWLADGGEIALIDVREEGQHCDGHRSPNCHPSVRVCCRMNLDEIDRNCNVTCVIAS